MQGTRTERDVVDICREGCGGSLARDGNSELNVGIESESQELHKVHKLSVNAIVDSNSETNIQP